MPAALPTVEQVLALPGPYELVVPPEYTDANGHMNIARFMDLHSDGGWAWMDGFGLGEETARGGGATTFDVEHHARYLREVHTGDLVAVRGRLLARTAKAVHTMQFIVNRTTGVLANTLEVVALSVDLATRRTVAFPEDVAAALDARLELDRALGWEAPVSGAMVLR